MTYSKIDKRIKEVEDEIKEIDVSKEDEHIDIIPLNIIHEQEAYLDGLKESKKLMKVK